MSSWLIAPQQEERLELVKEQLTLMVGKVKTLSAEEVESAASGPEAEATHFSINSALLAVPELLVPWASIDRAIKTISVRDRHRALVTTGAASGFFEQVVERARKLQQEQLKAAFAAATDGLMEALAPHLAEHGVSIDDTLPNGQLIVTSVLEAARANGMEQLEALMTNPKELARQAAAVKMPAVIFGLKFTFGTDSASDTHHYGPKLAKLLGVSTMQIEHHTSRSRENCVELQVRHPTSCPLPAPRPLLATTNHLCLQAEVKVFDKEGGISMLKKIDEIGSARFDDGRSAEHILGAPLAQPPEVISLKTVGKEVLEACSFNFLDADMLRREDSQPLFSKRYQDIIKVDKSMFVTKEIRMHLVINLPIWTRSSS